MLFKSDNRVLEIQERLRNSSRLNVTKETGQLVAGCDSRTGNKEYLWDVLVKDRDKN